MAVWWQMDEQHLVTEAGLVESWHRRLASDWLAAYPTRGRSARTRPPDSIPPPRFRPAAARPRGLRR
jgi:hypothetical protein